MIDHLGDGLQAAIGWGAVNALGNIERRYLGLDAILNAIPGGAARSVFSYLVKIFNVGVVFGLAGSFKPTSRWRKNIRSGGIANLGVTLLSDLARFAGEPGQQVQAYLNGVGDVVGDYLIMGAPASTAMNPLGYGGMGNYLTADGGRVMSDYQSSAMSPYGSTQDNLLGY